MVLIIVLAFGGNVVVKPVSWTFPSTHSVWPVVLNEPDVYPASEIGRLSVAAASLPTLGVYAFTSENDRVLLIPSTKSRGENRLFGANAPSPGTPPLARFGPGVNNFHVP